MNRRFQQLALAIILFIGLVFGYGFLTSSQQITVSVKNNPNSKVYFYKVPKKTDLHEADEDYATEKLLVKQPKSGEQIKIKKGNYVVAFAGNDDFLKKSVLVQVGGAPQTITIEPEFTDTKKARLLTEQGPAIKQVVSQMVALPKNYTISQDVLLGNGEWYGALIHLSESDIVAQGGYADLYRIVLHKTGDVWKFAAGPELSLSKQNYPDVPKDVLSAVNALSITNE